MSELSNRRKILCDALSGASSGALAATVVCPLDVIKTRLQVHGLSKLAPADREGFVFISFMKKIIQEEGGRGLYRGLSPTIIALVPSWAVTFTVYNQLKRLLYSHVDEGGKLSSGAHIVAASGAGAASAIVTNPLWVMKIRLMTGAIGPDKLPYDGVFSGLKRIAVQEGIRGLYSGLLPSLVGVSHVAINFPVYERLKSYLAWKGNASVDQLKPIDVIIASSSSKVIASSLTYPHEVIRAKLQEQGYVQNSSTHYSGVVDCITKVYRKEGVPGFYRGFVINLFRTVPANVITFLSYEVIHKILEKNLPS